VTTAAEEKNGANAVTRARENPPNRKSADHYWLKLVALRLGMFYHAVTDIHYGLKASATGRDGQPKDLPQDGVPGFRKLRVGAVRVDRTLGQGGAWRQGSRPDGG
jgi:hypothetical protein